MISASNELLQQQLEYTLLKPDFHSWWISKMKTGREGTLEEGYAIKLCFKLGKNATETYWMHQTAFGVTCMNQAMHESCNVYIYIYIYMCVCVSWVCVWVWGRISLWQEDKKNSPSTINDH